jgi:hypothetical protein
MSRRRRTIVVLAGLAWLGACVLLTSPAWRSAADDRTSAHPTARPAATAGAIGIAPLGTSKALPESLPGAGGGAAGTAETAAGEVVSGETTETSEAVVSTPEEGSSGSTPSSGGESSSESSPDKTILGFEG